MVHTQLPTPHACMYSLTGLTIPTCCAHDFTTWVGGNPKYHIFFFGEFLNTILCNRSAQHAYADNDFSIPLGPLSFCLWGCCLVYSFWLQLYIDPTIRLIYSQCFKSSLSLSLSTNYNENLLFRLFSLVEMLIWLILILICKYT